MSTTKLSVGEVVNRVVAIYVDQAPVLLPASGVVVGISVIVRDLLVAASPGLALVGLLVSLVATTLFTGMVVRLVADVQDGRRDASVGQLLQAVTPVFGQLLLVGILAGVGIVIGFVLIIIPGLILVTIWSVAAPVVVIETPGPTRALGRSRELVKGNGWEVFGVILTLYIVVAILTVILDAAAAAVSSGVGIVVGVIVGVLTTPLAALAAAVLYFELRRAHSDAPGDATAPPALGADPMIVDPPGPGPTTPAPADPTAPAHPRPPTDLGPTSPGTTGPGPPSPAESPPSPAEGPPSPG